MIKGFYFKFDTKKDEKYIAFLETLPGNKITWMRQKIDEEVGDEDVSCSKSKQNRNAV